MIRLGGSLKAVGFGDGKESHPQAALEAATHFQKTLFGGSLP
jgi:hypothetical protein